MSFDSHEWIVAIVGGLVVLAIIEILKNIFKAVRLRLRLRNKGDLWYGQWYLYVSTFKDNRYVTVLYTINISSTHEYRHSVQLKFICILEEKTVLPEFISEKRIDYDFEGHLNDEPNEICILVRSREKDRTVNLRFPKEAVDHRRKYVSGLWLAYDHAWKTTCGATVMSQTTLTLNEIKHRYKTDFVTRVDMPIIRIPSTDVVSRELIS